MTLSDTFSDVYGPWAVVTGASAGIGAAFAKQLAAAGLSVVVVARRIEKLEELATSIKKEHKVEIKVVKADLVTEEGRKNVMDATSDLDVGLLVNNAGMEVSGPFLDNPLSAHQFLLDLNIVAVTAFTHSYGERFVARTRKCADGKRRAGMIMLSSMFNSAVPSFSTYAASKAYTTALALAVRKEWESDRVDVISLEPGATMSEMNKRLAKDVDFGAFGFQVMPAEDVVKQGLEAFEKGEESVRPHLTT